MTSTRPGRQERGVRYAANDQDRLKRALLQPVQPWDKKWAASKNGRHLQVYKWVKSERQLVFDEDDDMDEDEEGIVPSGPSKEAVETPQDILTPLPMTPSNLPTTPSAPIPTLAPPISALPVEDLSTSSPPTHLTVPHTVASASTSALDTGPPPLASVHTPGDDEERSHTPKLEDLSDVEEPEEERDAEADDDDGEDPVAAARRQGLVRRGEEETEDSSFGVTLRREEEEEEEELDDEDDDDDDDGEDDEMLDEEMMDAAAAVAGGVGGFDAHDPSFDVAAGMMGTHAEMMREVEMEGLGGTPLGGTPLGETPQSEGVVGMGGEGLGELEEAEINFGGGTGTLDFGGLPPAPPPIQEVGGEVGFGEGEDSQGEFELGN